MTIPLKRWSEPELRFDYDSTMTRLRQDFL